MSREHSTVRQELADELQRFGDERDAVPICLVLLAEDSFEFVYPAALTDAEVATVEGAIVDALEGDRRPYTRI